MGASAARKVKGLPAVNAQPWRRLGAAMNVAPATFLNPQTGSFAVTSASVDVAAVLDNGTGFITLPKGFIYEVECRTMSFGQLASTDMTFEWWHNGGVGATPNITIGMPGRLRGGQDTDEIGDTPALAIIDTTAFAANAVIAVRALTADTTVDPYALMTIRKIDILAPQAPQAFRYALPTYFTSGSPNGLSGAFTGGAYSAGQFGQVSWNLGSAKVEGGLVSSPANSQIDFKRSGLYLVEARMPIQDTFTFVSAEYEKVAAALIFNGAANVAYRSNMFIRQGTQGPGTPINACGYVVGIRRINSGENLWVRFENDGNDNMTTTQTGNMPGFVRATRIGD
jgi:hypothetical protein